MRRKSVFIFSNLATSLDGKIATRSREHFPLGSPKDRELMQKLRIKSQVVVMGASTLRSFKKFCGIQKFKNKPEKQPVNVIVSSSLEGISPHWSFFNDPRLRRILFVTKSPNQKKLRAFKLTSKVILLNPKKPIAPQIIKKLRSLGLTQILIEGGGALMWDFASLNLIDEYYLTLTPRIVGGTNAPTLVDGLGFEASRVLNCRLKKIIRNGNELFLVYKKTAHRGA